MKNVIRTFMLLGLAVLSSACAGPMTEPTTMAQLGYQTKTHADLVNLPTPKGKIVVAVYKFADQTGQYKANATSTSFSTSVTQGATSMLIEALQSTKWFIPVEREGLNNLLTERKILMAKLKPDGKEDSLPKLYHAPILLEGGIITYETNVSTGGIGARYLGIGGSTQYQKDQIALYLRAVDVNRGDVLLSVSTTKSILSEEINFGVFKFIDTDKILEGELGYTRNEPPQLCVLEALEKAVLSLIIEGILDRKWELQNPADINNPVIRKYLEEKGVASPDEVLKKYLTTASEKNSGTIPVASTVESMQTETIAAQSSASTDAGGPVSEASQKLVLQPMIYKQTLAVQKITATNKKIIYNVGSTQAEVNGATHRLLVAR